MRCRVTAGPSKGDFLFNVFVEEIIIQNQFLVRRQTTKKRRVWAGDKSAEAAGAVSGVGSLIKVSCSRTGDGLEEGSQAPSTTPARWDAETVQEGSSGRGDRMDLQRSTIMFEIATLSIQKKICCRNLRLIATSVHLKHFRWYYLSLPSSSTISGGEILESWWLVISSTVMGVSGGNWSFKIVLDHNSSQLLCSPKPLFDVTWDNKK